ncbi:hypothetical protein RJT34_18305 [Clitoria ternatea]|uniref:Uncharacterized protein n=1 Tax=Clitoria ternatea TaxID=43366 RepID=A0AAN9PE53_CLITE
MAYLTEVTLLRSWTANWLQYDKWYYKKALLPSVLLKDFFDAPVFTRHWKVKSEDPELIRFGSAFVKTYKETVFTLLDRNRFNILDDNELESLQREIEDLTLNYSEESIYKACPNIMEMLTKNDLPSAKEFLRGKYLMDKEHPGRMTIYAQRCGRLEFGASELSAADKNQLRCVLSDSDQSMLKEYN